MKELIELIDLMQQDPSHETKKVLERLQHMKDSGELQDIARMLDILENEDSPQIMKLVEQYKAEQEIAADLAEDIWFKVDEGMWIRREKTGRYASLQTYPLLDGHWLCYWFHADIDELSSIQISRYIETVPEAENISNIKVRNAYAVFKTMDADKADEKYIAHTDEQRVDWLKKFGVMRR